MWPPKRLSARCSFIFGNRKKSDSTRSGLHGGCSMSQWNCSHSKACVCQAVCGCALSCNEPFHARTCLFGKITYDLFALQKTNNNSHLTVGGILNRHGHGHSYLCNYHLTRSDIQLHDALFNITVHWTPETNNRLQQNRWADCMRRRSLLSGWPFWCHELWWAYEGMYWKCHASKLEI